MFFFQKTIKNNFTLKKIEKKIKKKLNFFFQRQNTKKSFGMINW